MKINELIIEKLKNNSEIAVVSSFALSQEEMLKLRSILQLPAHVNVKNEVNKKVIAGFIIKIGSLVIDLSLKSKLREFYKRLYENL